MIGVTSRLRSKPTLPLKARPVFDNYHCDMKQNRAAILAVVLFGSAQLWAGHTLNANQNAVATAWLMAHPSFRMATDADCECADDIRTMRTTGYGGRWKAVRDYHPYVVTGDFNNDGAADFAIAVVDRSRSTKKFTLLVFNGPVDSGKAEPAFVEKNANLARTAFFYGPPRPEAVPPRHRRV